MLVVGALTTLVGMIAAGFCTTQTNPNYKPILYITARVTPSKVAYRDDILLRERVVFFQRVLSDLSVLSGPLYCGILKSEVGCVKIQRC